ncbi:DUF6011 domain-containing protein [Nocardia testacea]|uniref:DUF6011 domain-containing protein n=1 Tax=Nocardia testacea TaxID=248551 RepID=UPI003C2EE717
MSDRLDGQLPDGTPTRTAVPCKRCGGWLVSETSRARRLGPACARHEREDARRADEPALFELSGAGIE